MENNHDQSVEELLAAHRPRRLTLTALALVLATLWNLLFWNTNAGVSFFMYIVVFVATFTGVMWRFGHAYRTRALWLLLPILILAFNTTRFETPFVDVGIPIITVILLIIYCAWLTLRIPEGAHFHLTRVQVFENIFLPFTTLGMIIRDLKNDTHLGDRSSRKTLVHNILWGLAIAAPIFLVFLGLFMSADAVFRDAVLSLIDKLHIDWETFWRLAIILFWTGVLACCLYFFSSRAHEMHAGDNHQTTDYSTPVLNTLFAVLNLLFLGFVYFQVRYLFLGDQVLTVRDFTYAQYAREGFFQLLVAVGIAAVMGMVLYGTLTRTKNMALRIMAMIFLALSVVIAFAALRRLGMYEGAFGLTLSRFYASAIIILFAAELAMTIVLVAMRLRFGHAFAVHAAMILAGLTVVTSFNVEKRIVQINIDMYLSGTRPLDTYYLAHLSNDAMPTLFDRFPTLGEENKKAIAQDWIATVNIPGGQKFHFIVENKMNKKDWREFTFSSFLAQQAYTRNSMRDQLIAIDK